MGKVVDINKKKQLEKDRQEFTRLGDVIEDESAEYDALLERMDRKVELGGKPSEQDIDAIIANMGTLCRLSRERRNLLRKINPKAVDEIEEIEDAAIRGAIKESRGEFYKSEYGLKIVK